MIDNPALTAAVRFEGEVDPKNVQMDPAGTARVGEIFRSQLEAGMHPGAQLVILRHGQVVLDRAAGTLDRQGKRPVTPNSPYMTWSVTKAFTGICIHKLIEDGKVEWDAPVAAYWPEFGCKGKETATIRHVLLHQAGIPSRGLNQQVVLWPFWKLVTRSVAGLQVEYEPGKKTAYHIVNYGFILGEVVRRVTGKMVSQFLQDEFLKPLGMNQTWLGLPRSQLKNAAPIYAGDPFYRNAVFVFGLPLIRSAVIPAATLHSTARDLAVFYQMLLNGGIYARRRYLKPETIAAATSLGSEDFDHTIQRVMRWGHGFFLGGRVPGETRHDQVHGKHSTLRSFGHYGQATCMAWADPKAGLVVAFTTNNLLGEDGAKKRWGTFNDAIWDALC